MERSTFQLRLSRLLRRVGDFTSRSWVAAVVALITAGSVVALSILNFPRFATNVTTSCVAAVALIMLFVIQHTQSREQSATQLKLDELIRTSPLADDHLVHIELAEDIELIERETEQAAHHAALREEGETALDEVLWTPKDGSPDKE